MDLTGHAVFHALVGFLRIDVLVAKPKCATVGNHLASHIGSHNENRVTKIDTSSLRVGKYSVFHYL